MGKKVKPLVVVLLGMALQVTWPAEGMEIVRNGQPRAAVWCRADGQEAAEELVKYVQKISGAKLDVSIFKSSTIPAERTPAVVVGRLALELGLSAPPRTVSGDGYRIRLQGDRLLLAGETPPSTFFAACHFLEILGCRWFFDNPLGEVVPQRQTITIETCDLAEKPDFVSRNIWGPNWHGQQWQRHNRLGGFPMPTGHDWQHVPPKNFFKEHPEFYALRAGQRQPGNWLCTSNPQVRRLFSQSVADSVRGKGTVGVSISPPDGTGYCQCDQCTAEDVPGHIEPSSGRLAISDRYQRFYNAVAAQVLKANPKAILNFYAYADYSLPPRACPGGPPNLCAWIAPIRFCRLHSMANQQCASRQRAREVVEGWSRTVSKIGWREYNYNLAEATLPFSKISVWRDDIPALRKMGCLGLNIESLALWHIYGVHTYLVARLAWNADAQVDQILDDFYTRFCGRAAPHVKAYWERIDRAYREANVHSGSYYSLPAVWTPALVAACEADLESARQAADNDLIRRRVEMFRMGLENAKFYLAIREATHRCDFARAKALNDKWIAHMDGIHQAGIHPVGEYRRGYAPRFLARSIEEGLVRITDNRRKVVQLPDEWWFRYDPRDKGEATGWQRSDTPSQGWCRVKTYSATLNQQGIPEQFAWMWYRVRLTGPEKLPSGPLHLWFSEIDGRESKVFLNGEQVGQFQGARRPHEVEITGKFLPGKENVLVVKIDHRRITELMLGGIIQPVMIYAGPRPAELQTKSKSK